MSKVYVMRNIHVTLMAFSPIFQGILAPFTDLHYNHGIEIPDSQFKHYILPPSGFFYQLSLKRLQRLCGGESV